MREIPCGVGLTRIVVIAVSLLGASASVAVAKKRAPPKIECAIVANNCSCTYACEQVWNGVPPATCARACPNLDNPDRREKPPQRPCGVKAGKCAFLD